MARWHHKADAAIREGEEELCFIDVFNFRGDALDPRIRHAADELPTVAIETVMRGAPEMIRSSTNNFHHERT